MIKLLHFFLFKSSGYKVLLNQTHRQLIPAPATFTIKNRIHVTNKLKSNKLIN
jgi:hypothetical protein